jgi:DNA modification methylase
LAVPRDYGNPKEAEYVDWVCRLLEPLIPQLAQGASLALNVGNDVFKKGSPARSTYKERMLLALEDRFGLELMDTLIWENPSRPPGPLQWASLSRQQLNAKWEPIYWLTNDAKKNKANNRRVLQEHSQSHLELMLRGGESRSTSYGDGAHFVRPGSYSNMTEGKIPGNVIHMGHRCSDKIELAKLARAAGLPVHGATMPLKLARFIIEFLTEKDDLVVDPCGGWFRTAKAAEQTGRRWFSTEAMGEYVLGGALGFQGFEGFEVFGEMTPLERALA